MKEYRKAWINSGYSKELLEETIPEIRVITSDTGKSSVSCMAVLNIGGKNLILSDRESEKHIGDTWNEISFQAKVNLCFSKMQRNYDALAALMQIRLDYPVQAMVRAMEYGKTSLSRLCKKVCIKTLESFKMEAEYNNDISAYDLYYALCEMEHCDDLKGLRNQSVLSITEAIYRLISFDWSDASRPGPVDLR